MDGTVIDDSAGTSPATGTTADQSVEVAPEVTTASTGAPAENTPTAMADELAEFKADVARATGKEPASPTTETKPDPAQKTDEPGGEPGKEKVDDLSQSKVTDPISQKLTERPEWKAVAAFEAKHGKEAGKEMRAVLRGIYKHEYDLTQQAEKAAPALEAFQEMHQAVAGNPQGLANMRHLIKSFDPDPASAVPLLQILLDDAKKRAGLVVSSPELKTEEQKLQDQVSNGLIDNETAENRRKELLELQQARLTKERAEQARQTEAQKAQAAQQTKAIEDLNATEARWTQEKLKGDPDYSIVQELHGKFVRLNTREFFEQNRRYPDVKEATDLLEKSLTEAKAEAGKFRPKPRERQAVTGGMGSSGNNRQQPGSELDEFKQDVQLALKRHR